ncbi:DUF4278 domain-containing protein (plasmid) [Kovacikia minuta CCNUW1]|uniref:DUF4278 domain-containing protein n=1 Tax=Kovacikia minuta TaxID=2931930 RepID=UPI001CCD02BE|nr:DUF4278 domain-containing protein [Kovacikia minuta]UBF30395.1 DUF4278 domain-containing protein [Kovacikia minuta CCNUW1]
MKLQYRGQSYHSQSSSSPTPLWAEMLKYRGSTYTVATRSNLATEPHPQTLKYRGISYVV